MPIRIHVARRIMGPRLSVGGGSRCPAKGFAIVFVSSDSEILEDEGLGVILLALAHSLKESVVRAHDRYISHFPARGNSLHR
jgi:hypothetical protein